MDDSVLGKEGTTWYEVHKGHSSLIPVSLAVARINSHEDLSMIQLSRQNFIRCLVLVNSDVLTISRGDNISGAYLAIDENVYHRVKSVYMKGKFHTEFKEETLPGWYDEVEKDVFLKRNQVNQTGFNQLLASSIQEEKIYIYKREGRWQVGPDHTEKVCWLFSSKTEKQCDEYIRWFEPVNNKWTRNRSISVAPVISK